MGKRPATGVVIHHVAFRLRLHPILQTNGVQTKRVPNGPDTQKDQNRHHLQGNTTSLVIPKHLNLGNTHGRTCCETAQPNP